MGLVKKILITAVVIASLLVIATVWYAFEASQTLELKKTNLLIKERIITAEVAATPLAFYIGLSRRASLCSDCGMIFKFNSSEEQEFVMRDMNFPLDIIFINNHRIIKIAANLLPEGPPPNTIYSSAGPADQVLELNAGYAARWGFKVGDLVREEPLEEQILSGEKK